MFVPRNLKIDIDKSLIIFYQCPVQDEWNGQTQQVFMPIQKVCINDVFIL